MSRAASQRRYREANKDKAAEDKRLSLLNRESGDEIGVMAELRNELKQEAGE